MYKVEKSKMKKAILLSIPILFVIGAPMHFLYELTGKIAVIGTFAPVNESPWEHLKLAFYPILVWWIIYYFRASKSENFSRGKWVVSTAVATITAALTIIMFFYSYIGAFGIEFLALDIMSLLIGIAAGQCLGLHIYKHANPSKPIIFVSLGIIVINLFMFVFFTFSPPHIQLLRDKNTGGYGINHRI